MLTNASRFQLFKDPEPRQTLRAPKVWRGLYYVNIFLLISIGVFFGVNQNAEASAVSASTQSGSLYCGASASNNSFQGGLQVYLDKLVWDPGGTGSQTSQIGFDSNSGHKYQYCDANSSGSTCTITIGWLGTWANVTNEAVGYADKCFIDNSWLYYTYCSPSSVTNGSVSSAPTCTITCNSGYSLSGTTCVSNAPAATVDIKANNSNGPITIAYGASATISWSSTNAAANSCYYYWGPGWTTTSGSGSSGALYASKTYSIACKNSAGAWSATDSVTVNVLPTATISASPTSVKVGGTSLVSWACTNSTSATLNTPWATGVAVGTVSSANTRALSPAGSYTWTINCTGVGGSASKSVTVQVNAQTCNPSSVTNGTVGAAPGCAITCNSGYSLSGSACTIVDNAAPTMSVTPASGTTGTIINYTAYWQDTGSGLNGTCYIILDGAWNATACSGTGQKTYSGSFTAVGNHSVQLYGADVTGNAAYSALYSYTVTNPVPTATIYANGTASSVTATYNTAATLTWSSTNTTTCTGTNFSTGGALNNSTGVSTGNLYATKTYSISCTGPGGTANSSVVVHVLPVYGTCSGTSCTLQTGIEGQTYTNLCSNNTMSSSYCGGGGGGGGSGASWHSVCANNACIVVNGAGTNQCSTALNCAGSYPAQYYGVCAQGACVMVSGTSAYAESRGLSPCSNYGGTCPNPTGSSYNLSSSNDLNLSITKQSGTACSTNTTIVVIEPLAGFSDTVNLSVSDWGGLASYSPTANFSRTSLTSAQYTSGATLNVCAAVTAPSNNYYITVRGTGATSGKVIDRTVKVILHNAASSTWQEI